MLDSSYALLYWDFQKGWCQNKKNSSFKENSDRGGIMTFQCPAIGLTPRGQLEVKTWFVKLSYTIGVQHSYNFVSVANLSQFSHSQILDSQCDKIA